MPSTPLSIAKNNTHPCQRNSVFYCNSTCYSKKVQEIALVVQSPKNDTANLRITKTVNLPCHTKTRELFSYPKIKWIKKMSNKLTFKPPYRQIKTPY